MSQNFVICTLFFFKVYLFIFRVREHKQEGQRERERESEADSALTEKPEKGLYLTTLRSQAELTLIKTKMLN